MKDRTRTASLVLVVERYAVTLCAVALVGAPRLLGRVVIMFGVSLLAGAGLLWLWP